MTKAAFLSVLPLTQHPLTPAGRRNHLCQRHNTARRLPKAPTRCETAPPTNTNAIAPRSSPATPSTPKELIERFWALSNDGAFVQTLPLFTEDAVYHDTLYAAPFRGKEAIGRHLQNMEVVMLAGLAFVLDDLAVGEARVGARWHCETASGVHVPFSRGASMYTVVRGDGGDVRIAEAWDFVETPFKVAGIVLPVFAVAARLLGHRVPRRGPGDVSG